MRIRVAQERDEKIQFLIRNITRAAFSNAGPALHSREASGMTEGASSLFRSLRRNQWMFYMWALLTVFTGGDGYEPTIDHLAIY